MALHLSGIYGMTFFVSFSYELFILRHSLTPFLGGKEEKALTTIGIVYNSTAFQYAVLFYFILLFDTMLLCFRSLTGSHLPLFLWLV